jgi:glycosyltransferase involved in cell wall biosynthesis
MFLTDSTPVTYVDPWDQPLSDRLAALKRGKYRVAYYYRHPDNSTFRYRVYNMVQALDAAGSEVSGGYFHLGDLDHADLILDACDALVLCRVSYDDGANRLITKARARKRKVFFDVDDMVFDVRYMHLIAATLDQNMADARIWDFWIAYIGRIGRTLQLCDRAIVTNEVLAQRVRAFNDMPVAVIPNFMNLEQIVASDAIYDGKTQSGYARDEALHLGYFSGTPTHNRDFALIAPTIAQLLREDARLRLRLVGYLPATDCFDDLRDRIEVHAFRDFINLQTLIGSTEVNLVPLQDNAFTDCKSELKFFEAAAVGTVSVASPSAVLRRAITDGVTGHLANTFDWADKIRGIIAAMDRYGEMADAARHEVRGKYRWAAQVHAIEQAVA